MSVKSHFLDSGAFSLWQVAAKYRKKHNCGEWDYYDSDEFWEYIDAYAAFIKKHKVAIDYYANLDVIPNPELTWRNQQYLEDKGLHPIPVIHYKTPLKWLKHYLNNGYEYIGLGGLVGSTKQMGCIPWIDHCFNIICDTPKKLPGVKVHGFGVSAFDLLRRYPWYSVDSTNWFRIGAFGVVLCPRMNKDTGEFDFTKRPRKVIFSDKSPKLQTENGDTIVNYLRRPKESPEIMEWLKHLGLELGTSDKDDEIITKGVRNHYGERTIANLMYYQELMQHLPKWPQPYDPKSVAKDEGAFFERTWKL